MIKVLLVEDDTIVAKIILYYLEEEKLYEVKWAKTGGEALARARESFDVILMDVLLPDVNGIDLCEKLREYHDCPILFLSCLDDSDTIVNALQKGATIFWPSPSTTRCFPPASRPICAATPPTARTPKKRKSPSLPAAAFRSTSTATWWCGPKARSSFPPPSSASFPF